FENCGAAFQKNRVTVQNELLSRARNVALLLVFTAQQSAVSRLEVGARHPRDSAAVRAHQHAFLFERSQITTNGCGGDPQAVAQVGSRDSSLRHQNFADLKTPFFGQHSGSIVMESGRNESVK